MSRETGFRLGALGCCLLYIISFLFLPYVKFNVFDHGVYGIAGVDCLSGSGWSYLVLVAGIAAAICSLTIPSKPAAAVCLIAAFVALITFFLVRFDVAVKFGGSGYGRSVASYVVNAVTTVGFGLVFCILCGIGAAVLCFLSEYASKPVKRTPGLTADPDDEW